MSAKLPSMVARSGRSMYCQRPPGCICWWMAATMASKFAAVSALTTGLPFCSGIAAVGAAGATCGCTAAAGAAATGALSGRVAPVSAQPCRTNVPIAAARIIRWDVFMCPSEPRWMRVTRRGRHHPSHASESLSTIVFVVTPPGSAHPISRLRDDNVRRPIFARDGDSGNHAVGRKYPSRLAGVLTGVRFQVPDHRVGDVHAGHLLDAFEPGRTIDLQYQRSASGTQQVHACDAEPECLGGAQRGLPFRGCQTHRIAGAAAMQVRPEIAFAGGALHGGDHATADDEAADVAPVGLAHELLHQEVGIEATERLDHALRSGQLFGQDHAGPLRALVELDHVRRRSEHVEEVAGVVRVVTECRRRQVDPMAGEHLQAAQLVARAQHRFGGTRRVDAHHLELAQHRRAVEGDRRADARNHAVVALQLASTVMDAETLVRNAHVAAQRIEHARLVTARAGGGQQPHRRIQARVAGQDRELHGRGGAGVGWASVYERAGSTSIRPASAVRPSSIGNSMPQRSVRLISMAIVNAPSVTSVSMNQRSLTCPPESRTRRRSSAGASDRKSTRLNSSHPSISYAVFCLKKKKNYQHTLL